MAICISLRTLKDIRTERNLIQEDLAEATSSCSRTIGRIERGERNPSLEMAIRLAHYLNMGVEEIFTLDDNNSSYQKAEEKNPRLFAVYSRLYNIILTLYRITSIF